MNSTRSSAIKRHQIRAEAPETNPLKRVLEAHEVAETVLFLVSPRSSFLNGVVLPVDGGQSVGVPSSVEKWGGKYVLVKSYMQIDRETDFRYSPQCEVWFELCA